eukprot:31178-Pelagococcus_subviridis.AAC.9
MRAREAVGGRTLRIMRTLRRVHRRADVRLEPHQRRARDGRRRGRVLPDAERQPGHASDHRGVRVVETLRHPRRLDVDRIARARGGFKVPIERELRERLIYERREVDRVEVRPAPRPRGPAEVMREREPSSPARGVWKRRQRPPRGVLRDAARSGAVGDGHLAGRRIHRAALLPLRRRGRR